MQDQEATMICVICKHSEVRPSQATVTLERGATTLIVKHVPAQVYPNCGEQYVDEQTTKRLLESANRAAETGVELEVKEYAAA